MNRVQIVENLIKLDPEEVEEYVSRIQPLIEVSALEPAEGGLYHLKIKDGVNHEPFFLGEISVAQAVVCVKIKKEEESFEGGAVVMCDNIKFATNIAICDALAISQTTFREQVLELAEKGMERMQKKTKERKNMLAATKVDFSLLEG